MPEIQVTDDQLERLDALRAELADEMVGEYGHVRRRDALEYLLDRQAEQAGEGTGTDGSAAEHRDVEGANGMDAAEGDAPVEDDSAGAGTSGSGSGSGSGTDDDAESDGDEADGEGGDDGAMLDAMMNLLSAHEDKWREASGGDARYEVDLPDGSTEQARTKDDVRALLFKHHR